VGPMDYRGYRAGGKEIQQYWFHRPDNGLIVMAGLWHWQQMPDGHRQTFAIITTRANAAMALIHDRMPVVLDPARLVIWIAAPSADLAHAKSMLVPAPDDWLNRSSTLVARTRLTAVARTLQRISSPSGFRALGHTGVALGIISSAKTARHARKFARQRCAANLRR
jgi:putative SOS response-associated peptidase YedK